MATKSSANEKLYQEFQKRLATQAIPRILDATVPFYFIQGERIKRDRSGVFLRVGDDFFILTAAHDLMEMIERNDFTCMDWDEDEQIPIPVPPGAYFMGTEHDCRDIAVIHLGEKVAEKLLTRKKPLSLRDLIHNEPPKPGLFLACGYPQEWTTKEDDVLHCRPISFLSRTFDGEIAQSSEFEFDPEVHGAFDFSRNAIRADSLQPERLPSFSGLQGISGCGIWRLSDWNTSSIESWVPEQLKLVAIQHRYYERHGYVVGTWIKHVIDRLIEDRPQVRKAKAIIYPS